MGKFDMDKRSFSLVLSNFNQPKGSILLLARLYFFLFAIRRVRELEEENNLVGNSLRSLEIQTDKVCITLIYQPSLSVKMAGVKSMRRRPFVIICRTQWSRLTDFSEAVFPERNL